MIERLFQSIVVVLRRKWVKFRKQKIFYNAFCTNYKKKCLFIYVLDPFVRGVDNSHQNSWQAYEMAKIINSYGYDIDVVDYNYDKDDLLNKYDLLFDIHPVEKRFYNKKLNPNCKRIVYLTGSEPVFQANAEKERIARVKERRGVYLPVVRGCAPISKIIEKFDAFLFIGNTYNLKTFSKYSLPKVFFIPNTGYQLDIDCRRRSQRNFLFFAGSGQVHKGLDLLLEIFSTSCRDCELYICSAFKDEQEFCSVYKHELFDCDNIHPVGFLKLGSDLLNDIFEKCTYLIVPSCSEARMGSALTCMSVGIIPILTRECGYDEGEFIPIDSIDLDKLSNLVHEYANKDDKWVVEKSSEIKKIAQTRYSRENFTNKVSRVFDEILNG